MITNWDTATAEMIEEAARSCAPGFGERGTTAAEAREWSARAAADPARHPTDSPFWAAVAAELDALEARHGWRVIDGGDTSRANPLTRRWVSAGKRDGSHLVLVVLEGVHTRGRENLHRAWDTDLVQRALHARNRQQPPRDIDALTGEGLGLAFGAAELLVDCVMSGRPQDYDRQWRQLTRRYRMLTAALLQVSAYAPARSRIVPAAKAMPAVFTGIVNLLAQ